MSDKLTRNERKLATATENFNADSLRCKTLIATALEEQYVRVTPSVGAVCEMAKTMATAVNGCFGTFGGIADVLEAENFERLEKRKSKARDQPRPRASSHAAREPAKPRPPPP